MKHCIFLVDDDKDLLAALNLKFVEEGFRVRTAADGESALVEINKNLPDLVVLDVVLPGKNGLEICKTLRSQIRTKNIPILMLTARGDEIDRLLGLEYGADDYVVKPFNIREVILRIRGLLRRTHGASSAGEFFTAGCLSVDLASHKVNVGGRPVHLTLTEFKLLAYLIENRGRTKSRDDLLQRIWDYGDDVISRTIDTHIQRLRSKLKTAGPYIETVRGIGYQFQGNN